MLLGQNDGRFWDFLGTASVSIVRVLSRFDEARDLLVRGSVGVDASFAPALFVAACLVATCSVAACSVTACSVAACLFAACLVAAFFAAVCFAIA